MNRRHTLKWMAAAFGYVGFGGSVMLAIPAGREAHGYGTDPDLSKTYQPGDLWPLTFTPAQRKAATKLCDAIVPADAQSPSASSVGVVEFIDEWISAPYPRHSDDRATVLKGLEWLDAESKRRFGHAFLRLEDEQIAAICEDICSASTAREELRTASHFFARFRDLTASGFYTTPVGRKDLTYVGNIPLLAFEGPPLDVLKAVGLA